MTAETAATWDVSWTEALARLELDADRAEQLIRDGRLLDAELPPCTPPQLGPMPENLVPRAHRILDRHTEIAAQLAHAARETRQHVALLNRIEQDSNDRVPVYVDQAF